MARRQPHQSTPTAAEGACGKDRCALAGGTDAVLWVAEEGVGKGNINGIWRYMVLLVIGVNSKDARWQKAVVLTKLAAYKTSANERHYYLVCAHELEIVIREGFVRVQD